MEILFENQYTNSQAFYNEFFAYFYFKKPLLIVLNALLALAFIIGLLLPEFDPSTAVLIIVPPFVWIVKIIQFFKRKKLRYEQDLELNHGNPVEIRLSATEKGIEGIRLSNESKSFVEFSAIKQVVKTKNLYILVTKSKLALSFRKDSFTKGTPEEFLAFLKTKGFSC